MSKSKHPMQRVVLDSEGVARFQSNAIVRYLLESYSDMNALAMLDVARADREQFAQLIGYSVSGFGDLGYVSKKAIRKADRKVEELLAAQDTPPTDEV